MNQDESTPFSLRASLSIPFMTSYFSSLSYSFKIVLLAMSNLDYSDRIEGVSRRDSGVFVGLETNIEDDFVSDRKVENLSSF